MRSEHRFIFKVFGDEIKRAGQSSAGITAKVQIFREGIWRIEQDGKWRRESQ